MSITHENTESVTLDFDVQVPEALAANDAPKPFGFGTQIRKSCYFDATVRWGASRILGLQPYVYPQGFWRSRAKLLESC